LPNILVVPHIGTATDETRDAMACLAAENLLAGLAGKPLPTCLNQEVNYRPEPVPDSGARTKAARGD